MDDTEQLLTIGVFARRVGLAPSALRFYDDCGLLRPVRVDAVTGYRRYGAGQAPRAVKLRQLRAAGLPLVDAAVVLDGPEDAARDVLRAHLERTRRTADEARAVVEGLLREASGAPEDRGIRARARVGGAELASAVRQVAPAAATGAAREEFPVLGCVLLELADGEVRWVATDRYRLAVRVLRPDGFEGGPRRVLIAAETARSLAEWAVRQVTVDIECAGEAAGVRLRSGTDCREVPEGAGSGRSGGEGPGGFPDYRLMLAGLETGRHRVIVDRVGLRDAVAGRAGPVSLSVGAGQGDAADAGGSMGPDTGGSTGPDVGGPTGPDTAGDAADLAAGPVLEVTGGGREPVRMRVVRTGPRLRIAFDPAVLVPALEAGVGPDVLLEIAAPDRPVLVRSADQGSFTTLVMPVRESAGADASDAGRTDG
ncbi:DNA polymerase sliding clamp subunit (PCNA homolog) [Streptomyces sp. SceaMP-e96]|uniref:MerR family transcriptional regulator n=1 Tax=unclassified Streptomyces TaxID=2593676 RepID=UPI000823D810|nr:MULTISPECIES: MerR family transcriptional regulator [unclassified Streptomyces]MYT18619.1 MerR family DNA-binding transcriptional regulator [Streptomyces sp. SID4951]SCK59083.1 DNA polymerase sliding clamp subunit (PCNA homolog) [Streptomyces sp. SceaMP-e96]